VAYLAVDDAELGVLAGHVLQLDADVARVGPAGRQEAGPGEGVMRGVRRAT
jgi:hypothetical protein